MAGQESFAGFDMTQNNYYWYWQRAKPSSSPDRITPLANSMSNSMTVTLFLATVAVVIDGSRHHLISAHENSGHPVEEKCRIRKAAQPDNRQIVPCEIYFRWQTE